MEYNELGRTGLTVSRVGFGGGGIGQVWGATTEAEAIGSVHRALELGGTFFDVAPGYGDGKAEEALRRQGIVAASKKASRETNQGLVDSYIHSGGRIGAIVEVNCETDFVARTDDFRALAHDLAMQVAAMSPRYIDVSDVPEGEQVVHVPYNESGVATLYSNEDGEFVDMAKACSAFSRELSKELETCVDLPNRCPFGQSLDTSRKSSHAIYCFVIGTIPI